MKCKNCGKNLEYIQPRNCTCPGFESHRTTCPQYIDLKNSWGRRYAFHRQQGCPGFVPADSEAAIKQALGKEGEK